MMLSASTFKPFTSAKPSARHSTPFSLNAARAISCAAVKPTATSQHQSGVLGTVLTTTAITASLLATTAAPAAATVLDGATAHLLGDILRPTFLIFTFLYIVRIPMTWYPGIDGKDFPWSLAYTPTEPILAATRKVVPLVGGVDVTPIVWVGLLSFLNEILLGPQGLLVLIERQGGL